MTPDVTKVERHRTLSDDPWTDDIYFRDDLMISFVYSDKPLNEPPIYYLYGEFIDVQYNEEARMTKISIDLTQLGPSLQRDHNWDAKDGLTTTLDRNQDTFTIWLLSPDIVKNFYASNEKNILVGFTDMHVPGALQITNATNVIASATSFNEDVNVLTSRLQHITVI